MSEPPDYFGAPRMRPTEAGAYRRVDDLPIVEILSGLTLRPVLGTNMMLSFARYEPHAEAPRHAHVEEQIFVMLEGELEMDLDGEVRTMRPGDIALIPSWVPHRVRAGPEPASQLDIFSPPRQGLLDRLPNPEAGYPEHRIPTHEAPGG
jgi:quercetin dioxygenase-like cupin family protein